MRAIVKITLSTVLAIAATTSVAVATDAGQGGHALVAGHGCCR
jgi:hypothetical protein